MVSFPGSCQDTCCSILDKLLEPDNKELQSSSLDVTKAWTSFSASFEN